MAFCRKKWRKKLGLTERAYLNIEKDKNKTIDLYRIQEIAHILEVDLWDLIEKEEDVKVNISHNKPKGNNNCNFYSSPTETALTHELEKAHLEIGFLKEKNALLEKRIADLEEKIASMKEQK